MSPLLPKFLKPLHTLFVDPAARKMHQQIAVAVAHVVSALGVRIELALGIYTDVISHEAVFEHQMLERILFRACVVLAHEHSVIGHHLEGPAGECGAAEEGAARVDSLVVLGDEDVDVLDAVFGGREDVGGVLLKRAVEDRGRAHEAALEGCRGQDLFDEVVVGRHEDNVRVDEPDPFGVGVQVEGFGDGGDLGPCLLRGLVLVDRACMVRARTYPMRFANVIAAGVEPQIGVAMEVAVLGAVFEDALEHIGNCAVVAAAVAGRQDNNVLVPRRARIPGPGVGVRWDAPVPLWLALEVAPLRDIIVGDDGSGRLAGRVGPVVFDGHVAVQLEEDHEDGEG
jgi:hypothetical protein